MAGYGQRNTLGQGKLATHPRSRITDFVFFGIMIIIIIAIMIIIIMTMN